MNKKLLLYFTIILLWFNSGLAEEKKYGLTDIQIETILKNTDLKLNNDEGFLQCVEILRDSNLQRKFLRHQIKKVKCRLKYEELNANYRKEEKKEIQKKLDEIFLKELQEKQEEIEKNKPKLVNLKSFEVTDYESLFYLTKVKLFSNDPNLSLKLKNKKYLYFKPGQFISFDDTIVLSEQEFFKLPLEYNKEKHKFRQIILDFKKEKKKRNF